MSKDLQVGILLDYYGDMLTKNQQELAQMYYNDDLSLAEIAEITGITRQGVYDSVKRSEALLLELEQKLRIFYKEKQIDEQFEHIIDLCTELPNTESVIDYVKQCLKERIDRRAFGGI